MKVTTLVRMRESLTPVEIEQWFASDFAPAWMERDKTLRRLQARFRLEDVPQQKSPAMPFSNKLPAGAAYDMAIEAWYDAERDPGPGFTRAPGPGFIHADLASAWDAAVASHAALQMETFYAWPPAPCDVEERHAMTFMACLTFLPIPATEVRRHWKEHEEVAHAVHKGSARYERNWVLRTLAPPSFTIQGITDMSFKTTSDYLDLYWSSPEGERAVVDDCAEFVEAAPRLYFTGRRILKA